MPCECTECPGHCPRMDRHIACGDIALCRAGVLGVPPVKTPKSRSRGLGDTVEAIMRRTGVKALVERFAAATGVDCGCRSRRDWLNDKVPYNR